MAAEPDPYRTLGLDRTASLDDVRRAYRRLAKANHPDAAGEAALPRFLAIQAAYERLVGPAPGRARAAPGSSAATPAQAWEADPARSDATHRAYGGRARHPAGESGKRTGRNSKPGTSSGPAGQTSSGPASQSSSETAGGSRSGWTSRKATLGSTSYDGADRDAFEPDWVGASWYGTTSGTYWTTNPKEYADPRKHGLEYQARARRTARAGQSAKDDTASAPTADEAVTADAPSGERPARGGDGAPQHSTTSWWEAASGPDAPAAAAPDPSPRAAPPPGPGQPRAGSLAAAGRALTAGAPPTLGWRIAQAVIGWLPIGLAIAWVSGELTGCARFSATCDQGTAPVVWVLQALVLGVLLALPTVAGRALIAALVCLVVAVPTTLFVAATAGAVASGSGTGFLGVALALAWLAGIVGAIVMGRRSPSRPTGHVS